MRVINMNYEWESPSLKWRWKRHNLKNRKQSKQNETNVFTNGQQNQIKETENEMKGEPEVECNCI